MSATDSTNPWTRATENSGFLDYIDTTLRGCGQVIFMDNPLTGLLNFVAMFWGAYASGSSPAVAWGSLIATFVSTATAYALGVDLDKRKMGLYGYNGMLVGCGIPTFLAATPMMWGFLVIGSAVSTVVMLAVANVFSTWKTPALTFPFVLTTWLVMLAAYAFPTLPITGLGHAALSHAPVVVHAAMGPVEVVRASLVSVAQVFFVNSPMAGFIFLVALVVESRWAAGLAFGGALIAVLCAILFGADTGAIKDGLWGFSAVLTAVGVGCVFMNVGTKTLIYAGLATVVTVVVQGALNVTLGTFGIPTFTFPFVLTAWLFLLAQRNFDSKTN